MLAQYGFTGWFIGMQNSRYPMYIAIVMNVINIVCSSCFVFLFGMKVEGVALGTVVAQYSGVMMAWWLWFYNYKELRGRITFRGSLQLIAMRRFFCREPGYISSDTLLDWSDNILYFQQEPVKEM